MLRVIDNVYNVFQILYDHLSTSAMVYPLLNMLLIITFYYDYLQAGGSRKEVVIEEKRAVVAKNEETFQAQVFKVGYDYHYFYWLSLTCFYCY